MFFMGFYTTAGISVAARGLLNLRKNAFGVLDHKIGKTITGLPFEMD